MKRSAFPLVVKRHLDLGTSFSTTYVHHQFLGIYRED